MAELKEIFETKEIKFFSLKSDDFKTEKALSQYIENHIGYVIFI